MRMHHRFTEPTPASRVGFHPREVFIASWEIECCAPPPVVGSPSTWTLRFIDAAEFPSPELDHDSAWSATPWPGSTPRPVATQLSDGPITACWWSKTDTEPPAGMVRLRGHLSGTIHGGTVPDGFPRTTGQVQRIRLVTEHYARAAEGPWEPVPATATLTDIQRSPRWFTDEPASPPGDGRPWILQTGVLLDLAVPESG